MILNNESYAEKVAQLELFVNLLSDPISLGLPKQELLTCFENLLACFYDSDNILHNVELLDDKFAVIRWCLNCLYYFLINFFKVEFYDNIVNMICSLLFLALTQDVVLYREFVRDLLSEHHDILIAREQKTDVFTFCFNKLSMDTKLIMNIEMKYNVIKINTIEIADRFITVFCDVINCNLSTMIIHNACNDNLVNHFILCLRVGDFNCKSFAMACLTKCLFENSTLRVRGVTSCDYGVIMSVARLLIGCGGLIVNQKCSDLTKLESGCDFEYELFESRWLCLFHHIIRETKRDETVKYVLYKDLLNFANDIMGRVTPDISWPMVSCFCELLNEFTSNYTDNMLALYNFGRAVLEHSLNNAQFQRGMDMTVFIMREYKTGSVSMYLTAAMDLNNRWKSAFTDLVSGDSSLGTVNRFLLYSKMMNVLLLCKRSLCKSTNTDLYHVCPIVDLDRLLDPAILSHLVTECHISQIFEILSIFISEYNISDHPCKFSHDQWLKMTHLCLIPFIKKLKESNETMDESIYSAYCCLSDLEYCLDVRIRSFHLLSYIPTEVVGRIKCNVLQIIMEDDLEESELLMILESIHNGLILGTEVTNTLSMLTAIFTKYKEPIQCSVALTSQLYRCMRVFNCQLCAKSNQISRSIKLRLNHGNGIGINFTVDSHCFICVDHAEVVEKPRETEDKHLQMLRLLWNIMSFYFERPSEIVQHHAAIKSIIAGVFAHFSSSWHEKSIVIVLSIIQGCLKCSANKIQSDVGFTLEIFIKRLSSNANVWPRYQMSLSKTIDEIVAQNNVFETQPLMRAIETLLKFSPTRTNGLLIKTICKLLLKDDKYLISLVVSMMENVVSQNGIPEDQFFDDYKVIVAEFICEQSNFNEDLVKKFAIIFNIPYLKILSILLPQILISLASSDASDSIEKMKMVYNKMKSCEAYPQRLSHMFDLPGCVVYFYVNLSALKVTDFKRFIQASFDTSLEKLICQNDVTKTIHLLMIHLSENQIRVLDCLKWIATEVIGNLQTAVSDKSHGGFTLAMHQRFMSEHSIGTLNFFRQKIFESRFSIKVLDKYVSSLDIFAGFLGKEGQKKIYLMYFAVLKICLTFESPILNEKVFKLWSDFITISDNADFKEIMVESIAVLIMKKETLIPKIIEILKYIFTKIDDLSDMICSLHFILDYPELAEFHGVLKSTIVKHTSSSNDLFVTMIRYCIGNLSHDNEVVRQLAAKHLCSVLSSDVVRLTTLMSVFNQEKEVNVEHMDLIHELTRLLLLSVTRTSDKDAATVFGRCLGLLGAVDPGRYRELTLMNAACKETNVVFVDNPQFSFSVLLELGKAYSGMRTSSQLDATGLAVQQLMKIFGVNRTAKDTLATIPTTGTCKVQYALSDQMIIGDELWNMFETKFKDIFTPFNKTKYVHTNYEKRKEAVLPFFFHNESMLFEYWICNWTDYLIRKMTHPGHVALFQNFNAIVMHDEQFARFILPHVVIVLLIENDFSTVENISMEISTVLNTIGESNEGEKEFEENLLNTSNNMMASQNQMDVDSCFEIIQADSWVLQSAGQTVFNILDYLKLWLNNQRTVINNMKKEAHPGYPEQNYIKVKEFIKTISKESLAKASYKCGSFARALHHWMWAFWEDLSAVSNKERLMEKRKRIISGIMQTHAALHERDEISGYLSAFQSELEPFAQTLQLEYEGKNDLALSMYEQRLLDYQIQDGCDQYSDKVIDMYQSIFRVQMTNLGALPSVISRIERCLKDDQFPLSKYEAFNSSRIDALYRLGDWKRLERALSGENNRNKSWAITTTKALCNAKNQHFDVAQWTIDTVWQHQLTKLDLSAIEGGNYERVHGDLSNLSMLTEIEKAIGTGALCVDTAMAKEFHKKSRLSLANLCRFFKERYKLSEGSYQNQESLLILRYNIFQVILDNQVKLCSKGDKNTLGLIRREISEIWLRRCKIYRRSNQFSSALTCLTNVKEMNHIESLIERGKLFWKQSRLEEALACWDKGIETLAPEEFKGELVFRHSYNTDLYWKMMLLRARLSDITCRYDSDKIKALYRSVFRFNNKSEEAHFRLAHFLDRNLKQNKSHNEETLASALEEYGEALLHGSKFIYQSMPRLLSLWLDRPIISGKLQFHAGDAVTKIMTKNINHIPKFQFYVCLSQILSRLCHEIKKEVIDLLFELVIKIFVAFPRQTVWFLMAMEGSSYLNRRSRFNTFMDKIKDKKIDLIDYINKMVELCKALRAVSELEESNKSREIKLERSAKDLYNLVKTRDYSDVIIPLHHQLFGSLHTQSTFSSSYSPFPSNTICLSGINDVVTVLPSLTKPKKMVWLGSDGRKYIIVAKPKDDLRRDSRIMELNGMLNKLMRKKTETSHRQLYIRTYAVTPLGEQGGLIEWVNNTEGFRQIILNMYSERKLDEVCLKVKTRFPTLDDSPDMKYRKYMNDVVPVCPVVFHSWFFTQFPDPSDWYRSLQRYTKSTAVMSMVGYILGLGDRHGENILLDCTNGDIVHIDFNCLFNAGLTLQWPEMVPFRLTRNMVDALGPCRENNGLFRSSCEATLRLLRDEIEPIMAVFRPMYHDTLVEIKEPKASKSNRQTTAVSLTETQLEQMEQRLRGYVNQSLLSVEGQVNHLVADAVDARLLCQMFLGWAAYL